MRYALILLFLPQTALSASRECEEILVAGLRARSGAGPTELTQLARREVCKPGGNPEAQKALCGPAKIDDAVLAKHAAALVGGKYADAHAACSKRHSESLEVDLSPIRDKKFRYRVRYLSEEESKAASVKGVIVLGASCDDLEKKPVGKAWSSWAQCSAVMGDVLLAVDSDIAFRHRYEPARASDDYSACVKNREVDACERALTALKTECPFPQGQPPPPEKMECARKIFYLNDAQILIAQIKADCGSDAVRNDPVVRQRCFDLEIRMTQLDVASNPGPRFTPGQGGSSFE